MTYRFSFIDCTNTETMPYRMHGFGKKNKLSLFLLCVTKQDMSECHYGLPL